MTFSLCVFVFLRGTCQCPTSSQAIESSKFPLPPSANGLFIDDFPEKKTEDASEQFDMSSILDNIFEDEMEVTEGK